MALVELALPGTVFLYKGQELGTARRRAADEALRDPQWLRTAPERSRDRYRVPIPWENGPPFGFTPRPPWLPIPADWDGATVERQLADPASTLSFFRQALRLHRERPEFAGATIDG